MFTHAEGQVPSHGWLWPALASVGRRRPDQFLLNCCRIAIEGSKKQRQEKRRKLNVAYRNNFKGDNEEKKLLAGKGWAKWEASTSFINHNPEAVKDSINSEFALAFALIENHYFVNNGFLDNESQLLDNINLIRHIPTVIIQGRYDVVCPPTTAYELHSRWPETELKIAPFSGHSAFEEEITHLLIEATNKFSIHST